MDKNVVVSVKTIFLVFLLGLAGYIIYRLGSVIGILLIATFLVISIEPAVQKIMKTTLFNKPVSRGVAVLVSYALLMLVLVSVFTFGLPPIVTQFQKMIIGLAGITQEIPFLSDIGVSFADLLPNASELSLGVLSATLSVFSNVVAFVSLFVISIYMSLDWKNIKKNLVGIFPRNMGEAIEETANEIEKTVGQWVKGQLTLMLVIGAMSFVGLLVLGVRYPLALGLLSGILEIVPMLGPLLSAILAGIIGFADSPVKGIGTVALFAVIQQLENNILVPKIMQKVSGFSPLIILIALLVGGEFFGIIGVLMAVPALMVIMIILKRVLRYSE